MNFVQIIDSDIADSDDGACTSLWFGYCPHRCDGCHNKDFWDYHNEKDNDKVVQLLVDSLTAGPYTKSLSILGGEPLAPGNAKDCAYILTKVRELLPTIKVRVWTGYVYEDLLKKHDASIDTVLQMADVLIDGPFEKDKVVYGGCLPLRGSLNQRIIKLHH